MSIDEQIAAAEAARATGDESGALTAYLAAAAGAKDAFEPALEAKAMLGAGEIRALQGDEAAARTAFEEAVARAMEGGDRLLEADAHFALATLSFDHGRSKDGHDALLEALALYRDCEGDEARRKMARAVRLYGEHIGVLGSAKEAKEAFLLARAMFEALGDEASARGVQEDLARLDEFSR